MANFNKYNKYATLKLLRHDFRENKTYSNENIDESRKRDNITLYGCNCYQEARDKVENALNCYQHSTRKDLVVSVGYVITLPPQIENENAMEFWNVALDQVIQNFGDERIISAVVHNDETTPHLHIKILPIVEDDEGKKRFCCKEFLNRNLLRSWHGELQQKLEEKQINAIV